MVAILPCMDEIARTVNISIIRKRLIPHSMDKVLFVIYLVPGRSNRKYVLVCTKQAVATWFGLAQHCVVAPLLQTLFCLHDDNGATGYHFIVKMK